MLLGYINDMINKLTCPFVDFLRNLLAERGTDFVNDVHGSKEVFVPAVAVDQQIDISPTVTTIFM